MSSKKTLLRELREAGAPEIELPDLLATAYQLQRAVAGRQVHRHRVPLLATALVLLTLTAYIGYAQRSLPGDWSYGTKQLSEVGFSLINPSFRTARMMRRAEEVSLLVRAQANTRAVLSTLAAYDQEKVAYTPETAAAFSYCRAHLLAAAQQAPALERAAIDKTVASIPT